MVALSWIFISATCSHPHSANAQSAEQPISLEQSIASGRQLELEQRWQEAITHYEKLHKANPENSDVYRRLQIVRIHFDVWRRYTDESFISTVDHTTPAEAMELYSEILNKLELYYVEPIRLEDLLRNGTAFLEVALTEKDFLIQSVSRVPANQIENFRANVHRLVLGKQVTSIAKAKEIVAIVANEARDQIGATPTAVIYEYIAGAVGLLDPYSAFLTAGEYNEIMSQIEGNLIGIGVELSADKETLEIVDVFEGGPAHEAGLQAGDHITAVDGKFVSEVGAKRAADLLRGPEYSSVQIVVQRPDGSLHSSVANRRRIEVPSVTDVSIIDREAGIGYLRITNFQKTTPTEVDAALIDLTNQNMKMLVIDLRRNPGGLLDAAVEIADRFLQDGSIVSTVGRNGAENHNFAAHYANSVTLPLTVMIDEDSASASEIFAGAIRDNNRGLIIGRTSYGKGSVQGVFHNDSGKGGVRLTVSKFFSPAGYAISSRGIIPHQVLAAPHAAAKADGKLSIRQLRQMADDHDIRETIGYAKTYMMQQSAQASNQSANTSPSFVSTPSPRVGS